MKPLETPLDQFRQNGLRITPQRRVILELLADDNSHSAAEEVYRSLLAAMPDISRTTVYNTLRGLSDLGELMPIHDLSEGGHRYDTNNGMHHHLYRVECHKLMDIDRDFEGIRFSPEEASGHQIVSRQVTFYGICPDCQVTG